jgi:N-acetylglucosaminyl-diphospho-decaprenol L-rhamnosyltransferase
VIPDEVVAVVVTHLGDGDVLEACLEGLGSAGGVHRCLVIDNSDHPPGGPVAPHRRRSMVVDRHAVVNQGFGAAANRGFRQARELVADPERSVFVLLNDDVVVTQGWLDPLCAAFGDPGVGAVQPMLVFDGSDRVNSLGVVVGPDGAGNDDGLGGLATTIDRSTRTIDAFTGGAVAFRPAFIDATGGFDERYFLYYEDVDLSRRGAELGWSYRCAPASVVKHRKGASTGSLGSGLVYLRERNRLWSAFRNEPRSTILGAVWLSVRRLRRAPRLVHLRALIVGVGGGLWRLRERGSAHRPR